MVPFVSFLALAMCGLGDDPLRVFPAGSLPPDGRLQKPRTLDDYHPWTPPQSTTQWAKRREQLRIQVLVSQGLWPLPERTPLDPVVHGKVDRGDYTIEKVLLRTRPGHYLAGNLYRPKAASGKLPVVLCPHGHWNNGRFYDAGKSAAENDIKSGGESFPSNAQFPLQALPAMLARLGYMAFAYDMIGYADSKELNHPRSTLGLFNGGFEDAESLLRLHSFMGLQTWNGIRAIDFVCSLPDVDVNRIAVTGGSGGGTQTFMLCAVDDRPHVSFPTVMVSTAMQGGCVCENAPLLRIGTGNIELAALHAPKPLGMTGANDWTKEIETKGLPELKRLYALLGKPDDVAAWCRPEFPHNYNQVSREYLYGWLNRFFKSGQASSKEQAIPVSAISELSVFDATHPRPKDFLPLAELKTKMRATDDNTWAKLKPTDAASWKLYRRVVEPALAALMVDQMPEPMDVLSKSMGTSKVETITIEKFQIGRKQAPVIYRPEAIPVVVFRSPQESKRFVIWIDAHGKTSTWDAKANKPNAEVARLLASGVSVVAPDVFLTGEFHPVGTKTAFPEIDKRYAGYYHCYNRSVIANRVHDILTTIGFTKHQLNASSLSLIGLGEAGAWTLLAKGLAGEHITKTAASLGTWRFKDIKEPADPRLTPGGLKYGDLIGLSVMSAPGALFINDGANLRSGERELLESAYRFSGEPTKLTIENNADVASAVGWILK